MGSAAVVNACVVPRTCSSIMPMVSPRAVDMHVSDISSNKHVRFRSNCSIHNDFTPYGVIYGDHPRNFHFGPHGEKLYVSPFCLENGLTGSAASLGSSKEGMNC